jgi:hypothetical protein
MGLTCCPETPVKDYHSAQRNIPDEHRSHQHRCGSLKSQIGHPFYAFLVRNLCKERIRNYSRQSILIRALVPSIIFFIFTFSMLVLMSMGQSLVVVGRGGEAM